MNAVEAKKFIDYSVPPFFPAVSWHFENEDVSGEKARGKHQTASKGARARAT